MAGASWGRAGGGRNGEAPVEPIVLPAAGPVTREGAGAGAAGAGAAAAEVVPEVEAAGAFAPAELTDRVPPGGGATGACIAAGGDAAFDAVLPEAVLPLAGAAALRVSAPAAGVAFGVRLVAPLAAGDAALLAEPPDAVFEALLPALLNEDGCASTGVWTGCGVGAGALLSASPAVSAGAGDAG